MQTAEPEYGKMTYVNLGPKGEGFEENNTKFALYHDIFTDIAIWLPDKDLLKRDGELYQIFMGEKRFKAAMQSALEAILRATALHLQINAREINGILYKKHGEIYHRLMGKWYKIEYL